MGPYDHAEAEGFAAPAADFGIAGLMFGFQLESGRCCHDWFGRWESSTGDQLARLAQFAGHSDGGAAAWTASGFDQRFGGGGVLDVVIRLAYPLGHGSDRASGHADLIGDLAASELAFFQELLDFANDDG